MSACKTQLLSFALAARYPGRAGSIIAGILIATVINHLIAASLGDWISSHVTPDVLRWTLCASFLGFAAWALIPDRLDDEAVRRKARHAFSTTVVLFFLAEMGDKTQLAMVALGHAIPTCGS